MHKNAMKYNKTQIKWCINKHGASKIIDTFEMYHHVASAAAVSASNSEAAMGETAGSPERWVWGRWFWRQARGRPERSRTRPVSSFSVHSKSSSMAARDKVGRIRRQAHAGIG
jgi:hypothetical protein